MAIDRTFAFIIGIPVLIIMEILRYRKAKLSKKKFIDFKEISIVIFSIYIIALAAMTLLLIYRFRYSRAAVNIIPVFNTIKDISMTRADMASYMTKFWITNIIGNLLLLAPLAAIAPIIFKKLRSIKATMILCFLVSLSIEFLQYLFGFFGNSRSADIDDVILNTLGGLIGFSIFKIINRRCL